MKVIRYYSTIVRSRPACDKHIVIGAELHSDYIEDRDSVRQPVSLHSH